MKSNLTESVAVEPAAPAAGVAEVSAWDRFWFTPADPTVLGLIRICAGLITFYTFLAYTWDLQALLGKDAWMDLPTRQAMYRQTPFGHADFHWGGTPRLPMPTEAGPLQKYWKEYFKKWGDAPPPPWPRDAEEAARIEEYRFRWQVDPRLAAGKGEPTWSLWYHVTDPATMAVIQVVLVLISFLFLIGFCTRVTSALTWVAALWYMHRATAGLFGVDAMMAGLLLYLAIGPSGAALSVDRLIARWWARNRARVLARWNAFRGRPNAAPAAPGAYSALPAPSVSANVALRLIQIHLCIIYLSAGLSKLQGTSWWTGTAVWSTIANFEFAPMQHWWYLQPLRVIGRQRWLFELTMSFAGYFTLFFEIGYAFLIWGRKTRWLVLGMGLTMHGFIGIFMGLKTFSMMMLTMNVAFVPPETVRWFLKKITGGRYGKIEAAPDTAPEPGKMGKATAIRQDGRQVAGASKGTR